MKESSLLLVCIQSMHSINNIDLMLVLCPCIADILKTSYAGLAGTSYTESWPEDPGAGLNVAIGTKTS